MRRLPITAILTAGACALSLAAPVAAQTPAPQNTPSSANVAGLRYLTWPGRTYRPAPAGPSTETADAASAPAPVLAANAPNHPPIIPHGGQPSPAYAAAPSPSVPPRQGLTPASAWIGSQAPAYPPQPAPPVETPEPQPYLASMPPPVAPPWSRARAAAPISPPSPPAQSHAPTGYFAETAEAAPPSLPVASPVVAPAPRPVRAPAPAPRANPAPPPAPAAPVVHAPAPEAPTAVSADASADPMAPRRDAPIFRLQRPSAQPAAAPTAAPVAQAQAEVQPAPAAQTPQGGARYYSVHRQAGRQPDATPLPAPVYLDALPVDLTSMPASADLAEPPAAPNLIRNANGRLQALPANEDPVLP